MDQLPGIFVYLCVAIVVPVVIARYGVRADWRTVRNTCLIWYGFLLLGFSGYRSQDGFGWALIFAMFFSIPAIPVIALGLKGWNRLGGSNTDPVSAGADRRWWRGFPLSLMSPAQWSLIALVVGGYALGTYWYEQRDLQARAEILRQFLSLPDNITFASVQPLKSPAAAPRIAAIVRFTEPQFNSFSAQLENVPLWQQGLPSYDGAPVAITSTENFRWRDLPLPVHAGNRFVNWTKLSAAEIRSLRRGRALCVALQRKPGGNRNAQSSDVSRYAASDCSELAKTDRVAVIVLGALDLDTRTLHMIIN